jgi:hypothetical protein
MQTTSSFSAKAKIYLVLPAKAGIQKDTFRPYFPTPDAAIFDWPPFWQEKTHWIPAFAGMTGVLASEKTFSILPVGRVRPACARARQ